MAGWQQNMLFAYLGKSLGVDLFSHDFVRDPSYVEDRCRRVIGREVLGGQSLLRRLLHAGMSDEDRMRIFPGKFDLGNARSIPDDECTYEALGKELDQQRSPDEARDDPSDKAAVARMLKDTAALLGHAPPHERQAGAGQVFKVAKLLHGFKQREGLSQLMSILRAPTAATASLELTNPYPSGADSDLRWHMIDLHGYLSAEIPAERLAEIDGTFGQVRSVLDEALIRIERVLKTAGRPSPDEVVQRYKVVLDQWTSRRNPPARQELRADEQLYLAMHALDFLHFAEVERKLRSAKLLQCVVVPAPPWLVQSRIRLCDLLARPVPDTVRQLHPLLSAAVGEDITPRQFRGYLESAHTVLDHWVSLQQVPASEDVDALTGLAAIVVAREMRERPASYKPGLHAAARGQSHSVKAAMKSDRPVSSTHEEFERIVNYAVRWMRYALSGQTAVFEAQLALQMRFIDAAVSVLNTYDTEVMATFLSNLEGYAAYGVNGVPRLVALKNVTMQDVTTL